MKQWFRRFRAHIYYLGKPFRKFLPLLLMLGLLLLAGSFFFHHLYTHEELSYLRALYVTYSLIFMEVRVSFPDHWILQVFYFIVPVLGLVVILDGILRFSYHIVRYDESGAEWIRAMARTYKDHVILCGLGKLGLRTLQQLIHLGQDVIVLERNPNCENISFAKKHGIPVLIGTGREEGVLNDLNVAQAKSIILATDNDIANLEMALDARRIKPDLRVVMRLFDQDMASKVREAFHIHLAFSTSALAAPLFATSSSDRSIVNSFYVGDLLLVVANLVVNPESELIGKKIRDLGVKHRLFFLAHVHDGKDTHFPPGDMDFRAGDRLTVQTDPEMLKTLHKWNRDKEPY